MPPKNTWQTLVSLISAIWSPPVAGRLMFLSFFAGQLVKMVRQCRGWMTWKTPSKEEKDVVKVARTGSMPHIGRFPSSLVHVKIIRGLLKVVNNSPAERPPHPVLILPTSKPATKYSEKTESHWGSHISEVFGGTILTNFSPRAARKPFLQQGKKLRWQRGKQW